MGSYLVLMGLLAVGWCIADLVESLRPYPQHPSRMSMYMLGMMLAGVVWLDPFRGLLGHPGTALSLVYAGFLAAIGCLIYLDVTFRLDIAFEETPSANRGYASVWFARAARRRTLVRRLLSR